MEPKQAIYKYHTDQHQNSQHNINNKITQLLLQIHLHIANNNLHKHKQQQESQCKHKHKKPLIITLSHTVTDPRAVMIKPLHTHVTIVAMGCSGWTVDEAGVAELYLQRVGFHHRGVEHRLALGD